MRSILLGAAACVGLTFLAAEPASAACTTKQVRTVGPCGAVSVKTVQNCTPDPVCENVKTRKVRPNGTIVITNERVCR